MTLFGNKKIHSLEAENEELRGRISELEPELERQRKRAEEATARSAAAARELAETRLKLEEAERFLDEAQQLESLVDEWGKMKENYERKISVLRSRLADANKRILELTNPRAPEVIDLLDEEGTGYRPNRPSKEPPHEPTPDDNDWLQTLP